MKKVKFLSMAATVAATAMMMTSCGNDNEAVSNSDRVAVQFSAGVADVQTRAADQNWDADDQIGIYMIKNDESLTAANILENVDNRLYKATAAGAAVSFTPAIAGTEIYYPTSESVKFIAYYPYTTPITGYKLPINLSVKTSQSAIDVLYALAGTAYSKTSGTVNLPFVHKLVKLVFNISNAIGATETLTGLTVNLSDQKIAGELNLVDGEVTASGDAINSLAAVVAADGTTAEAIVLAGAQTGQITFTKSNGDVFTADIPTATFDDENKYTYTVTLKKQAIVIIGEISAWTSGGTETVDAE
jgi:hypothetical protein